jgi:hypothetical protein
MRSPSDGTFPLLVDCNTGVNFDSIPQIKRIPLHHHNEQIVERTNARRKEDENIGRTHLLILRSGNTFLMLWNLCVFRLGFISAFAYETRESVVNDSSVLIFNEVFRDSFTWVHHP